MKATTVNKNKNLIFMTMEGSFFMAGQSFFGENTIVPLFVYTYTGSMQLLGLTLTLLTLAKTLPKLLLGQYVDRTRNMSFLLKLTMLLHRPLPLLLLPVLLLVKNQNVIFIIYVTIFLIFWSIFGVAAFAWMDVFGRTIDPKKRGRLQGNQQLFGGITSFLAGYLIKFVLDSNQLTTNIKYFIIFGLGGALLTSSALAILPVKDEPRPVKSEEINLLKYYKGLMVHLSDNKDFNLLNIMQVISRFGDILVPFIIIIAASVLKFSNKEVSTLIVFELTGSLIGGFAWGNLSHSFGNRVVIIISEITGVILSAGTLIAILLGYSHWIFIFMCFVSIVAGARTGGWLGYGNYMLDVAGEHNRIDYMVINSLILFPLFVLNYLAAYMNDKLGYIPLILLALVSGIVCIIAAFRLKDIRHK